MIGKTENTPVHPATFNHHVTRHVYFTALRRVTYTFNSKMDTSYGNYGEGGFSTDAQFNEYNASQRTQQTRTTLSPVTIKQINDATQPIADGEFVVNNVSLNMVSFVGVVRKVESTTSAHNITIEDGTGSVEVRRWVDEKAMSAAQETEKYQALENKYVYVTGSLKEFNQKKNVLHAVFREITDHNEVLYHLLYAISNHLEAQGLLKSDGSSAAKSEPGLFVSGAAEDVKSGDVMDKIMALIAANTPSMPEGVPARWISDNLGLSVEEVKEKCHELSEMAKIYQGYDESSYFSV